MADLIAVKITIRNIRDKLDLTQQELADRFCVFFSTANRWEGWQTKPQKAALDAFEGHYRRK